MLGGGPKSIAAIIMGGSVALWGGFGGAITFGGGSAAKGGVTAAAVGPPNTPVVEATVYRQEADSIWIAGGTFTGSGSDTHAQTYIWVDTSGGTFSPPKYHGDTIGAQERDSIGGNLAALDSGAVVDIIIAYEGTSGGWSAPDTLLGVTLEYQPTYNAATDSLLWSEDWEVYDGVDEGGDSLVSELYGASFKLEWRRADGTMFNSNVDQWSDPGVQEAVDSGLVSLVTGRGGSGQALQWKYANRSGTDTVNGIHDALIGPSTTSVGGWDGTLPEVACPCRHVVFTAWLKFSVGAEPAINEASGIKGLMFFHGRGADFTGGTTEPAIGDTLVGRASGDTGVVEGVYAFPDTGSWIGNDAIGRIAFTANANIFTSTDTLDNITSDVNAVLVMDNSLGNGPGRYQHAFHRLKNNFGGRYDSTRIAGGGGSHPTNATTGLNHWRTNGGEKPRMSDYNDGNWHQITIEIYTRGHASGNHGERIWMNGVKTFDNVNNVGNPLSWQDGSYRYTSPFHYLRMFGNYANNTDGLNEQSWTVAVDDAQMWVPDGVVN